MGRADRDRQFEAVSMLEFTCFEAEKSSAWEATHA